MSARVPYLVKVVVNEVKTVQVYAVTADEAEQVVLDKTDYAIIESKERPVDDHGFYDTIE